VDVTTNNPDFQHAPTDNTNWPAPVLSTEQRVIEALRVKAAAVLAARAEFWRAMARIS
jgi:hypothetical protein